ncbi:MAG: UDP-N-acetylglucosamine 2-epimerase (non-hydrolyzing) [Flavobacteriales bacterium]|nr:UDP-N-acetylglucosamine 2-epimerase (non-hydrolyzing) [Flavobacteriales bacterium]HRO41180.1 UDP-N-acetylglucosamine 2-epimerase (non-hydrolyzing) [Flavobacteriales bacterium]HRP83073.1 UDP-N-acetylglucosamine 2-epimerase (non-hydrolyzing) [Flavobacteriales bacterium]
MKKLMVVVGTRPNFIKVTRFKAVAARRGMDVQLVHTGQHYDDRMSTVFFDQFGLRPDRFLDTPQASPAAQMGHIMIGLETEVAAWKPDLVMVPGDVNSTLAGALVANKMGLPLAHLESGLRSGDMGMPEEINRILTDRITDHFFVTEQSGIDHLIAEGRPKEAIHLVGNTMIDTLVAYDAQVQASTVLQDLALGSGGHVLMTIHRPATVDHPAELAKLVELIAFVAKDRPVVFPVHPRTTAKLEATSLMPKLKALKHLRITGPMDYFNFQQLIATCAFVITDSGGIQEETTYRRVPCLTLRPNTERPITVTMGTNELITFDLDALRDAIGRIEAGTFKKGEVPPLWDGHATERVFDVLEKQ